MMASKPCSSSRRRRLFELLAEQQDPFLLDVYLLENGYTKKTLNSEVSVACTGYPWILSKRLQNLASRYFKRHLSVIVNGKDWKTSSWYRKSPESRGSSVTDIKQLSYIKKEENRQEWECMEESPVSVLELHSENSDSPVSGQCLEENNPIISSSTSQTGSIVIKEWDFSTAEDKTDISQMIKSDFSDSIRQWIQLHVRKEEIGAEIGQAIFEEVIDDIVLDIIDFLVH